MRRHAGLLVAMMVLLVASASWGFATGRIQKLFAHAPATPVATPVATLEPKAPAIVAATPAPAPVIEPAPVVVEAPPPVATPVRKPRLARVAPVPAPTMSPLYAHAHELYFHGGDYAKALDALDDYLAQEPTGQFVVEAKYNRALCLIHLGQLADAKLALLPFAQGEVTPAGYRQGEAKTLVEKIDRRTNPVNGTK
jgi:TolA-binding protein